ncbi:MAG: glycosyltransferase family 4 protein [Candidatus Falkowbacteria bacterium]|nr:glycosyltransferase family 4 protein [Candidatus Falkowbacteria bacterium]
MKILYLIDYFPPEKWTCPGSLTLAMSKELQGRGHKIFVVTTTSDKSEAGESDYQGIDVFRFYSHNHERWLGYLGIFNPYLYWRIKKIIREIKPDVTHCHNIHQQISFSVIKLARKYSKKVFITAHDVMMIHYNKFIEFIDKNNLQILDNFNYKISEEQLWHQAKKRYNPLRRPLIRYYLQFTDKIFTVSHELGKVLSANGINNTTTIHNFIDSAIFDQVDEMQVNNFKNKFGLNNKKIILFGGRLSEAKGWEELKKSFIMVADKINNTTLLIIGDANKYADYIKKNLPINLQDKVIFTGLLTGTELICAYKSCDLVVFPSICFDTFGMINLEAMAARKPVIATCFGGSKEVVEDRVTGFIINPLNIKVMAEKIIKILSDENLAKRMGEQGYQRANNLFSISQQADKLLSYYN